jgi:hypothetical protein
MRNSALFLDRDGVINVDRGHIHRPDQFEFVPGIFHLARFWASELGRLIIVVRQASSSSGDSTLELAVALGHYHCRAARLRPWTSQRCGRQWRDRKQSVG